jgi:hypothetical protein
VCQPAQAVGACEAHKELPARRIAGMPRPPFAIGDSVMLGAAEALAHAGIRVDARGCRQMGAGLGVLAAHHHLPRVVIVALGTNWVVTAADLRRALRIVGPGRKLVLVTPRPAADRGDAERMRAFARRHPHHACVADWRRRSAGRSDWAPGDGIHLSYSGIAAFTRLLKPYRRITARHPEPCGAPAMSLRWRPRRR